MRPLPVSSIPGELVVRIARARRPVRALFDRPDIQPGDLVFARRSPFVLSAGAYWIEAADGTLLSIIDPRRFDAEFEVLKGGPS